VNPISVWEGIDTKEEQGRNRLVKLALHILSVTANSAGCERAFSHMGLVHTAIRSRLSVEKVQKTTVVGMDIKQAHIEAGLAHSRGHRNFEAPTSSNGELGADPAATIDFDIEDGKEILDFNQLAEQLIGEAADLDGDLDTDDDEPPPPLTIRLPLHAIHAALPSPTQPCWPATIPKTTIPLKSLFIYPTDRTPPSTGMDYFWQRGIENLDREMKTYEILCSGQEGCEGSEVEAGFDTVTSA
jgi:hypothetical protein